MTSNNEVKCGLQNQQLKSQTNHFQFSLFTGKRVPITLNSFTNYNPPLSPPSTSPTPSITTSFQQWPLSSSYLSSNHTNRSRRSAKDKITGITVETAVFIDETLYQLMQKTFPGDTEHQVVTYVLTIMNAVQLLFRQPSLGMSVNISIVLLDILKTQPKVNDDHHLQVSQL